MAHQYLPAFIDFLECKRLLRFDILGKDERRFENRFMIQKYVYLARYFNLDMGFNFSMYLHGPYSSDLADDYYELAKDEVMTELIFEEEGYLVSSLRGSDLNGFDQSSFFAFVNGRDHEWLETATTLLSLSRHITNRRGLVERAANMKEHIPVGTIESILGTLERNGLLPSLSS